ncbi:hypothetical protein [Spiroplasma endosymbiont of Nomada rufipes]|uniref:hypothetical protein n=1 Tax=Spiroplasma endosymbiont of Nomada rufipes TaxID=3077933 RepID=UPI00376F2CC6
MTNFLSFSFFKTKSFKTISLALALSLTSSLMIVTNHQSNISTVNESNKLSGFHITVKEKNKNLISEANTWNSINNNYEDFIRLHKEVITEQFNDWSDLINKVNNNPNDDISKDVNKKFKEQIENKANNILPDNGIKYFTDKVIGRSVAKQSFNDIVSFGYVYVGYHDNSLPAQINNGIFATVNPRADFNNYFSIPYMIKPSDDFLNSHKSVQDRLAILPLNNGNTNDTNQPMLAILAKNKNDKNEQLLINDKKDEVVDNDSISYAILNHKPDDHLKSTSFNVSVKDSGYSKTIKLTNNSSNIQFSTISDEKVKENPVIVPQYLVQNNSQDNKNTLIVMNKAIEKAKVNISDSQQHWLKWKVDSQTLQKAKNDLGTPIKDGDNLTLNQGSNFQVYCIGLDTSDLQRQAASEQYITVYRSNTKIPNFPNCTDFFEKTNNLLAGFQQYLTSATNNSIKIEYLKNNAAGEFLSWFIQYQGDITKQNYVNYLQSNNSDRPWDVNISLTTKMLVNNWNIIIICGFIISFLTIIPIVVVIIRKKKYLK